MPALVTTLRAHLEQADAHFAGARVGAARKAYGLLLERAQERVDNAMTIVARSMLARCALKARDVLEARDQLSAAARLLDPNATTAYARYRMALVRLALEDGPPSSVRPELLSYLAWAEEASSHDQVIDAVMLLADHSDPEERVGWLERGIEHGRTHDRPERLGDAYNHLAAALDQLGQQREALDAYVQALRWHEVHSEPRSVVAALWAVGSIAGRLEEWALAREHLERALQMAEALDHCSDLMALALADLALVTEEAGDVVDARRLLLRALQLAHEQDLELVWPERVAAMRAHAVTLELT